MLTLKEGDEIFRKAFGFDGFRNCESIGLDEVMKKCRKEVPAADNYSFAACCQFRSHLLSLCTPLTTIVPA